LTFWATQSVESEFSCKGAAIRRGLEPGSREIAIVRSRYQATTSEETAGWKRCDFVKC
jgi:hypothetical protein